MNQAHRRSAASVLGAFTGIVCNKPLVEIVGDAAVERIIGTSQKVADPIWHLTSP